MKNICDYDLNRERNLQFNKKIKNSKLTKVDENSSLRDDPSISKL